MGRIVKWLFYLLVLAALALVAYAYIGPFISPEQFKPPQTEFRQPVTLDAQ